MTNSLRPASTVLLVRDGGGKPRLEVFMVQRAHAIDAFRNALVFPGGKVDGADRNAVMRQVAAGAEGLSDDAVAFRASAIRELFEETGVLLARDGDGAMVVADPRIEHARAHLNAGDFGFIDVLDGLGLRMAFDLLVPYARWIAPAIAPKRFDTVFYLVQAPDGQDPVHDGHEAVDSRWVRPADMIAAWERGEATVVFPTRMNLLRLAAADTAAGAFMRLKAEGYPVIEPRVEDRPDGKWLTIPAGLGYPQTEEHISRVLG